MFLVVVDNLVEVVQFEKDLEMLVVGAGSLVEVGTLVVD